MSNINNNKYKYKFDVFLEIQNWNWANKIFVKMLIIVNFFKINELIKWLVINKGWKLLQCVLKYILGNLETKTLKNIYLQTYLKVIYSSIIFTTAEEIS